MSHQACISKQLIIDNPHLLSEWDRQYNEAHGLLPEKTFCGSNKRAMWVCKNKHHWKAMIYSRANGCGCPYCSGKLPIAGETDLCSVAPALAKEWNYEKNQGLCPEDVTAYSGKKVWWRCSFGHEWQAKIEHRKNGSGCPFCSGRMAIAGETDLATCFPNIAAEWDFSKNVGLLPSIIKPKSNKKIWWICSKGHEYIATVYDRVIGNGCPYCSNNKVLIGFNDLQTIYPSIAQEWDYNKNNLKPNEVTSGSSKKIWWICTKGHSYCATVVSRTKGNSCPYCSNKKTLYGFNDLETRFPSIAKEWNFKKNKNLVPGMFVFGSGKKVWWICKKGHEWECCIIYRTRDGNGCPICNKAKSVSFPEKAILYYVQKYFSGVIGNYHGNDLHGKEIDVYLKDDRIGIEYDGDLWHQDINRDIEKNEICAKNRITLIRVREPDCPYLESSSIDYRMKDHSRMEFNRAVIFVLNTICLIKGISINIDVSIDRDFSLINDLLTRQEIEKSLASVNPELSKEWHPTQNGSLLPTQIAANSGKKVWWKGKCGHEWMAVISSRNAGKSGCPVCRGLNVLKGFNDLESQCPTVAAEWNYELNGTLYPSDVTKKSNKTVWWKCPLGHAYQTRVSDRTREKGKNNCPYCSNHRILEGFNDLKTTHPSLSLEWDYSRNGDLKPNMISAGSGKKVWWICKECNNEWEASIVNRSRGSGCPRCYKIMNYKCEIIRKI